MSKNSRIKTAVNLTLSIMIVTALVACGTTPSTTVAPPAAAATATPAAKNTPGPAATEVPPTPTLVPTVLSSGEGCAAGAPKITWFVGLGGGTDPDVIGQEQAWVDAYNKSQTYACVLLQVVHNPQSYDTLHAMMAAGTPPDIVGPVGKMGRENFKGSWADVTQLAKDNNIDLSNYDPALMNFLKDNGIQIGLPFALFPGVIWYNKALFDEAQLPYPPHKVGEQYQGKDWTIETMSNLAKVLTVDANGADATDPAFDHTKITQFGLWTGYTGARRMTAMFGGAVLVDANNNAVIPESYKAAWTWYYDGIWTSWFMPNYDYSQSERMGKGNPFGSGNVAMTWTQTWYTCCFDMAKLNWDMAVVPSYNGVTTAGIDGDTFSIPSGSKNQALAFKVLHDMVMDKDLGPIYGGIPGNLDLRQAFFDSMNKKVGTNVIDWQVAVEMLKYPNVPHHESWMPNMSKSESFLDTWFNKLGQTPGLDLTKEFADLQTGLEAVYKAAP
jgi:multiple sugar transport system substrate-binding protein